MVEMPVVTLRSSIKRNLAMDDKFSIYQWIKYIKFTWKNSAFDKIFMQKQWLGRWCLKDYFVCVCETYLYEGLDRFLGFYFEFFLYFTLSQAG